MNFTNVKKPQTNAPVDQVHQLFYKSLVTNYLSLKVFGCTDQWAKILSYTSWAIIASCNRTLKATSLQAILGREVILNHASIIDFSSYNRKKSAEMDIYNDRKNSTQFRNFFVVYDLVCVDKTGIYCNRDNNKHGLYMITEV